MTTAFEWQPIETCPFEELRNLPSVIEGAIWVSDGHTVTLAIVRGHPWPVVQWVTFEFHDLLSRSEWDYNEPPLVSFVPTHWMRIPAALPREARRETA